MGTPLAQWLKTYRANRAAIRASLQPAQPAFVVAGTVIAIGSYGASFIVGDVADVARDLAVQGAVLAGLAFVPARWAERQAVIVCVAALVAVDGLLVLPLILSHWLPTVPTIIDKATAGWFSPLVLIVQALSPLLLRFGNEMRLLAKLTKETQDCDPEDRWLLGPQAPDRSGDSAS